VENTEPLQALKYSPHDPNVVVSLDYSTA